MSLEALVACRTVAAIADSKSLWISALISPIVSAMWVCTSLVKVESGVDAATPPTL